MVAPFLFNIEKCTCGRVYETELLYEVPEIEEEERKKWNQQKVQFCARSLIHFHDLNANESEKNSTFV